MNEEVAALQPRGKELLACFSHLFCACIAQAFFVVVYICCVFAPRPTPLIDLQGEAEGGEDADGEQTSAVVAGKGQSRGSTGVVGGRCLGVVRGLGGGVAAGSRRGSLGSIRARTRAGGRGSRGSAGGRAAAGAVIGVANELGTALGSAAGGDAVKVVGVAVDALVDVFTAGVARESLFVAGDVGAHAIAGANARVGEGVLGMALV